MKPINNIEYKRKRNSTDQKTTILQNQMTLNGLLRNVVSYFTYTEQEISGIAYVFMYFNTLISMGKSSAINYSIRI